MQWIMSYLACKGVAWLVSCVWSCQIAARHESATVVYETLRLNLSTAADSSNETVAGLPVCHDREPLSSSSRRQRQFTFTFTFTHLLHRRTRTAYVYNGCLAWYNVVLTPRIRSSVKYSQLGQSANICDVSNRPTCTLYMYKKSQ